MVSRSSLRKKLFERLGAIARRNIQLFIPTIRFGRLKKSITFKATTRGLVLSSYYYWARWANDGRKEIRAKPGKVLVFFDDPTKDKRIMRGYPRKPESVRKLRLDEDEFRRMHEEGELVVTKKVAKAPGLKFLEQGIKKTRDEASAELRKLIRGEIRRLVRRSKNQITVRL